MSEITATVAKRAFKVQIAAGINGWTLWRIGSWFACKHSTGMVHTGSAGYIRKLWNDRFAAAGQKVSSL